MSKSKKSPIQIELLETSNLKPPPPSKAPPPDKSFSKWDQYKLLLWKNYLVTIRSSKSLLFQLLAPVLICLFLSGLDLLTKNMLVWEDHVPAVVEIDSIPKCVGRDCITVGVGLTAGRTEWTDYVVNYLSEEYQLELGRDIKILTERDPLKFLNYLSDHLNTTQVGVIFCTGGFDIPENRLNLTYIDCQPDTNINNLHIYSIVTNRTMGLLDVISEDEPYDYYSIALKKAIDEAILSYHSSKLGLPAPKLSLSMQDFPETSNRYLEGYDVVATSGAFYFFIPPMVIFVVTLIELLREKESRLRQGLNVMGMYSVTYWGSWLTKGIWVSLVSSNILCTVGILAGFDTFTNTPYLILIIVFSSFVLAMIALACFLATVLKSMKAGYTISYGFILGGLVLQSFMANVRLLYMLHSDMLPMWIRIVHYILFLYPPFNFAKAYGDIARRSGRRFSRHDRAWVNGPGFTWRSFVHNIRGDLAGMKYRVPCTGITVLILLADAAFFMLLTWYFDHVMENNRSSGQPPYFIFTKKFWRCRRRKSTEVAEEGSEMIIMTHSEDSIDSVEMHRKHVIRSSLSDVHKDGVKFVNISKTFAMGFCGVSSAKDIHAVKSVYLEVNKNTLLALLGHNGAGKTTMMNMLTGIVEISEGNIIVSGHDISENLAEARRKIGYCPQFDVLWDELTAREHLLLFGQLKGYRGEYLSNEVIRILKSVNLLNVADHHVSTYSGGMKRRLSVCISGIGDPDVIILDEPTTGLDPISRRQVWELIKELKKDRAVILTTHSMEEADVLSDCVAVIVDGQLKTIGTSLNLKNTHGDGYRLSIVSTETSRVLKLLRTIAPSGKVIDESAGSLIVSVSNPAHIADFASEVERESELRSLISDWSLSHSTLEEVFMKLTSKKNK